MFAVYYTVNERNLDGDIIHKMTQKVVSSKNDVLINGLGSCEIYFIRIQITGPKGYGPLSKVAQGGTDYGE